MTSPLNDDSESHLLDAFYMRLDVAQHAKHKLK